MSKALEEQVLAYRRNVRTRTFAEATYWLNQYVRLSGNLMQEIRRLREENERLRENAKIIYELEQLAARSNNELLVENERLRKDAERWVFYRSAGNDITLRLHNSRSDVRDATIDAARGAK